MKLPLKSVRQRVKLTASGAILAFTLLAGLPAYAAATPTPTPVTISTDPCATKSLLTVRNAGRINYSPDTKSATAFFLQPGMRFFVCTNINVPGYTMFILTNSLPKLYVPVGTFG